MKPLSFREIKNGYQNIPDVLRDDRLPVSFFLDGVHNLANIGSIFRTADAIKASHIFLHGIEPFDSKKLSKYSRSTNAYVPYSYVTAEDFKTDHRALTIVACEYTDESSDAFDFHWNFPVCIILGSERHGISREILAMCEQSVHLPAYGNNTSINVAAAASAIGFHALKAYLAGNGK